MLRSALFAVPILLVLFNSVPISASLIEYSGELVWDAGETQINASGDWATTSTKVEWTVTKLSSTLWSYSYTFTGLSKSISHLIIETSENLDLIGDVLSNVELEEDGGENFFFGNYSSGDGGSNPGMPGDMYGVKFNLVEEAPIFEISFTTDRDPIWGDFYAKDGKNSDKNDVEEFNYAYNTGFTAPDPDILVFPPDSELVTDHILVPDTIPEPATMLLLLGGAVVTTLRRFRR